MVKLRGAVIGFGELGQSLTRHINCDRNDAEVVVACDTNPDTLETAANTFGLTVTRDCEVAVGRGDIQFVLVTSPNTFHHAHTLLAARASKHVFCEKPVALTVEDALEMADAVEGAGVVNLVDYTMRFIPAFAKVKELVNDDVLGRLLSLWQIRTRGSGLYCAGTRHPAIIHPKDSGGWAIHHTCHSLDMFHWLAGPMTTVYAKTETTVPDRSSEEMVCGLVGFQSGASGILADTTALIRERHTTVIGTKGSVVVTREGEKTEMRLRREGSPADEHIALTAPPMKEGEGALAHFFHCIRNEMATKVTIRDAIPSLEAAIAMRTSASANKPVNLYVWSRRKT